MDIDKKKFKKVKLSISMKKICFTITNRTLCLISKSLKFNNRVTVFDITPQAIPQLYA